MRWFRRRSAVDWAALGYRTAPADGCELRVCSDCIASIPAVEG